MHRGFFWSSRRRTKRERERERYEIGKGKREKKNEEEEENLDLNCEIFAVKGLESIHVRRGVPREHLHTKK